MQNLAGRYEKPIRSKNCRRVEKLHALQYFRKVLKTKISNFSRKILFFFIKDAESEISEIFFCFENNLWGKMLFFKTVIFDRFLSTCEQQIFYNHQNCLKIGG